MGFSDEDLAEAIRRGLAWREDIQAHELEKLGVEEAGLRERLGVKEAGLGERQRAEFGFKRPEQVARIGEIGARARGARAGAAREEYGLEFERGLEPTLKDIVKQKKTLGKLDIDVLRKQLRVGAAPVEEEAPTVAKPAAVSPTRVAKPERRMRPWIRREIFGGPEAINPLARAAYGYRNIADWLKHFGRKGYEYAFPRSR